METPTCIFISSLILLVLAFSVRTISEADYIPSDYILLSCGATGDSFDEFGRKWTSDNGSKYAGETEQSLCSPAKPHVTNAPYADARIFNSAFTYTFNVTSGYKFVRLYFYLASYTNLNASKSRFSVMSGCYTFIHNFSAAQTAEAMHSNFIMKEYSIHVPSETLDVTFIPVPNMYAFVNGIEVVSHPNIYNSTRHVDNKTVLQNVYRLNVGGNAISPTADTGLYRPWYVDSAYIYWAGYGVTLAIDPNTKIRYPSDMPTFIAPVDVYKNARLMGGDTSISNMTWIFKVDSGFKYLARLHFCEVLANISVGQRVFTIFLGNQTVKEDADVMAWAGEFGTPTYKDYVVGVFNLTETQQDLWLELVPNTNSKSLYHDTILNGVEIFKLNDSLGNLAGGNLVPSPKQDRIDPRSTSKNKKAIIGGSIGDGISLLLLAGSILWLVYRRHRQASSTTATEISLRPIIYGRRNQYRRALPPNHPY